MNVNRNRAADVAIGYAADPNGRGIAFAAVGTGSGIVTVRVAFVAVPLATYGGREFGYAAVAAVATELRKRGFARIRVRVADPDVVGDLSGQRKAPLALGMPYVHVRCALNGFSVARVEHAETTDLRDLETRARAELNLQVAA